VFLQLHPRIALKQQLLLRRLSRPSQQIHMNDRDLARLYFQAHKKANKTLLVLGHLELKNVPHVSSVYVLKTLLMCDKEAIEV
jgi:hypothetical protein